MRRNQLRAIECVKNALKDLQEKHDTLPHRRITTNEQGVNVLFYRVGKDWLDVEQAIKTSARAFNTVSHEIADFLEDGTPLPPIYQKIALQILRQEITAPANPDNREPRSEQYRAGVVTAVAALRLIGVTPTTGKTDSIEDVRKTGCSMVAEFIKGSENTDPSLAKRDYAAVEVIWKMREKHTATKGIENNRLRLACLLGYAMPSHEDYINGRGRLDDFIHSTRGQ